MEKIKYLFILTTLICFASCSSAKKKESVPAKDSTKSNIKDGIIDNQGIDIALNADSDSKKAGGLETAYFDFNASNMGIHLKNTLDKNVDFLIQHRSIRVRIEGNCDERGSVQFNLALGEKRAKYVRDYFISKGIDSSRMEIISYGKERPLTFGHDEDSWANNRRANFVVIKI